MIFFEGSSLFPKMCCSCFYCFTFVSFTDTEMLPYENINLVLEGIDTLAIIQMETDVIGTTDNMFVPNVFSIKHIYRVRQTNLSWILLIISDLKLFTNFLNWNCEFFYNSKWLIFFIIHNCSGLLSNIPNRSFT